MLILRPYQNDNVAAIRAAFARHRRVLYVLPTGGGKTVVFAYIVSHAAEKGNTVIILAHRAEIADQISAALDAMGIVHSRIQPGYDLIDTPVRVGMVQTVARRLDKIAEPRLLVIDEAHHAVAGTWEKIAAAWPDARVLGVTATPERLDGVGLRDAFDEMVVGPDVRDLIGAGYLAPFRYLAPSVGIDLVGVRSLGGDYNIGDLAHVVDDPTITGNVIEQYQKHLPGRTAIAFTCTVDHAEHVAQRFCDNGIAAASIDGSMSADDRRRIVGQLRIGDIRVLTSCEIVSEGFDAPAVGGAILLRPTQSFALYRQQIGRCLRPKPDGSTAVILDHVQNWLRNGLPDAAHAWSLDSKRRAPGGQDNEAGPRMCRVCRVVFPRGATADDCADPVIGCLFTPREIREQDGDLQEVTPNPLYRPEWARGIDIRTAAGTQWLSLMQHAGDDPHRLRQIQEIRGYKRGWVFYVRQANAERRRRDNVA